MRSGRDPMAEVLSWTNGPAKPVEAVRPTGSFDLKDFIHRNLTLRRGPVQWDNRGIKFIVVCPFNPEHNDAVVTQGNDGPIGFSCPHNSCADKHWRDVREKFDGPTRSSSGTSMGGEPPRRRAMPRIYSASEPLSMELPMFEFLIEQIVPARGAFLCVGAPKSGKTLTAAQIAVAVAGGRSLFEHYRVVKPGPVMVVEQDDPAGDASFKAILERSRAPADIPLFVVPRVPFSFGPELLEWADGQIRKLELRLLALDSYTALRSSRTKGVDIVKVEQTDLTCLDDLGKRLGCTILVVHHSSKGSASADWSEKAAGTYAMAAATEGQMHISRFPELEGADPERLVRIRSRHAADLEMVIRFRPATLDYEHVIEGGAAAWYPLILQIRTEFAHHPFSPKALSAATGTSRATAHRQIDRLYRANALVKQGHGEYVLTTL